MTTTNSRYINLFTDFGFKKIFGEEPNKDLLIAFLNELLLDKEHISDLTYLKNERLGKSDDERKAVFDLYCTNHKGEKFIVEVQRVKQEFFKDRALYYSTFAIQEQAEKGRRWRYELKSVYTIAIMDFVFDNSQDSDYKHLVKLVDVGTNKVFYDKLSFIYLEVPKFDITLSELSTNHERWMYALKNLHRLHELPKELHEGVFTKLFEVAEISKMSSKDRGVYEESLKDYWDLKSSMDTYFAEGRAEGKTEGKEEGMAEEKKNTVLNFFEQGIGISVIATGTQLSEVQVKGILKENGLL